MWCSEEEDANGQSYGCFMRCLKVKEEFVVEKWLAEFELYHRALSLTRGVVEAAVSAPELRNQLAYEGSQRWLRGALFNKPVDTRHAPMGPNKPKKGQRTKSGEQASGEADMGEAYEDGIVMRACDGGNHWREDPYTVKESPIPAAPGR